MFEKFNNPCIISDKLTLKANFIAFQNEEPVIGQIVVRFLTFHDFRKLKKSVSLPTDELDKVLTGQIEISLTNKIQHDMLRVNFLNREYDELLERIDRSMDSIRTELTDFTRQQIENQIILTIKRITNSPEEVDIYTNFLDLGITSIQMIQIKVAVEALFKHEIGNALVFRHKNVKELAIYIYWNVFNRNASMPTEVSKVNEGGLILENTGVRSMLEAS